MAETKDRRLKRLTFDPLICVEFCRDGGTIARNGRTVTVQGGIPETARLVDAWVDVRGNLCLLLDDDGFPAVPEGEDAPELYPEMRVTYAAMKIL